MLSAPPAICTNHRRRDRVAICGSCGSALCTECIVHTSVGIKCRTCTGVRATAPVVEGGTGASERRRWPLPVAVAGLLVASAITFAVVRSGGGSSGGIANESTTVSSSTTDRNTSIVGAGGLQLGATLTVPAGAGAKPVPGVLVIPGGAAADRNALTGFAGAVPNPVFADVSKAVAANGMAALRYDRRGTAAAQAPADRALAFDDFVTDAKAGVDLLANRRETQGAPIAVVGFDDGGLVALRVAAADPRVKAVVLISTTGRPLVDYLAADFIANDPANGPAVADRLRAAVTEVLAGRIPPQDTLPSALKPLFPADPTFAGYLQEIFRIDPAADARKVNVPALLVRGGLDTAITEADVTRFQASFPKGAEVIVGPQADHTILLPVSHDNVVHKGQTETPRDAESLTRMGQWLRSHLSA